MPRPDRSAERRRELMPIVVAAFVELGYRRTTTAELAARCGVRENILYRLWPDKRAMFVAALDEVYRASEEAWSKLLEEEHPTASAAERILDHEASHLGEHGLYRILFAGLSESDDPTIAEALAGLYGRFQTFVRKHVVAHREAHDLEGRTDPTLAAWAIVGLGTVATIGRELDQLSPRARRRLLGEVGRALLE